MAKYLSNIQVWEVAEFIRGYVRVLRGQTRAGETVLRGIEKVATDFGNGLLQVDENEARTTDPTSPTPPPR